MKKPRGETQNIILKFIKEEITKKGYPPSVRDICHYTGLKSTSTVHGHLIRLEKNGLIKRNTMIPRAIKILSDDFKNNEQIIVSIPVLGKVPAGTPLLATEFVEDMISLPECMLGKGEFFVLKVRGDSMIDAGINDGDNIVIRKQSEANNGEIVVAMIDDEATVKRYYKENGYFKLEAENKQFAPIIAKEIKIIGKVVSLYRIF